MFPILPFVTQLVPIAAVAIGGFILSRLRKSSDFHRAQYIRTVVEGIVGAYLATPERPALPYVDLVAALIKQVLSMLPEPPTTNQAVLEREVKRALLTNGVKAA
jgi:hypothetical protein